MENNISSDKLFYDMVKEWTINDHYNPGIKAEVIWDMLLSEFVPELVAYTVNKATEPGIKDRMEDYKLISKEYPIMARKNDVYIDADGKKKWKNLSNAKADYLVESDNNIFIVELKTTNDSFDIPQIENYFRNMADKEVFGDFYRAIIDNAIEKSYCEKQYKENRSEANFRNHAKYLEHLRFFLGISNDEKTLKKSEYMDLLDAKLKERSEKALHLVYISFYPITNEDMKNISEKYKGLKENVINIALTDQIYEGFKKDDEKWKFVRELIEEVKKKDIELDFILDSE